MNENVLATGMYEYDISDDSQSIFFPALSVETYGGAPICHDYMETHVSNTLQGQETTKGGQAFS